MRNAIITWVLLALGFAAPRMVAAHKINSSYTNLVVSADTVKVRVRFDDFDMIKIGLDQNGDGLLFYEEMEEGLDQAFAFVQENLKLRINGQPVALLRGKGDISPDNKGNMFANVYMGAALATSAIRLEVQVDWPERFGDEHKNLAKILLPGQPLVQAIFSAEAPLQTFVTAEQKSLAEQIYEFISLFV